jgi:hypothetical protein
MQNKKLQEYGLERDFFIVLFRLANSAPLKHTYVLEKTAFSARTEERGSNPAKSQYYDF